MFQFLWALGLFDNGGITISTAPGVGPITWTFAPTYSPVPVVAPTYSPTITMTPS